MSNMYRFGRFVLDPKRRIISCDGSLVPLTAKAFDILVFLAENPNRVITKGELLEAVWSDTFVEEGNLTQYISHLRKALGDKSEDSRLIVTITRKGYQFTADVVPIEAAEVSKQAAVRSPASGAWKSDAVVATEAASASSQPEFPAAAVLPREETTVRQPENHWRIVVVFSIVAVVLVVAGYISWRRFRTGPPSGSQKIMLAVLPFENLTGDPKQEYLADGLTEELISQLGRLHPEQLGVIGRTSVMGYKHTEKRLDEIGRDLSVQYVLEGSLRRGGDRFRITVQLIQIKDQSHLWSQDYDYGPRDILSLEDAAALAVAGQIQLHLTPQQQTSLTSLRSVNPDAFDAYLQGRYFYEHLYPRENLDKAARYFEQAIKLDPNYAPAWTSLSQTRRLQVVWGSLSNDEGYRQAQEAVERALALDPNLAEAHAQMGWLRLTKEWDWAAAGSSFQRALVLDPGNSTVLTDASYMAAYLGRFDEALKLARRAVELDPLNAVSRRSHAEICYWAGRNEEAVGDFKRALEVDPGLPAVHALLGIVYMRQGRAQEALAEMNQEPIVPLQLKGKAMAYYALAREAESDSALAELVAKYPEGRFSTASVYAFRGETDQALDWLQQAYANDDNGLRMIKIDPLLNNLRRDPRYAALLKKMRVPE